MMLQVYRIGENGKIIRGEGFSAFINNFYYHQTIIKVFEDGMIDCWGLVTFEEFKIKVSQGWVVTQVPKGAKIICHHLYYGNSTLEFYVEIDDFVREVEDTINKFQGKPTVAENCQKAFGKFLTMPTAKNRRGLQKAYEAMPKHLRHYVLGDMDSKDYPIKKCIENEEVSKEILEDYKARYEWLLEREA